MVDCKLGELLESYVAKNDKPISSQAACMKVQVEGPETSSRVKTVMLPRAPSPVVITGDDIVQSSEEIRSPFINNLGKN